MGLPIFTLFMFFIIWFAFARSRVNRKERTAEKTFWDREEKANATRRKDISAMPYISIPAEALPFGAAGTDESVLYYENQIRELADTKILNLTGMTNTDIKLTYGAPNLTQMTQYDQNFITLVRVLNQWGNRLYELGYKADAARILEFAVHSGSDVKGSFALLQTIYRESGQQDRISELITQAGLITSIMKDPILKMLKQP